MYVTSKKKAFWLMCSIFGAALVCCLWILGACYAWKDVIWKLLERLTELEHQTTFLGKTTFFCDGTVCFVRPASFGIKSCVCTKAEHAVLGCSLRSVFLHTLTLLKDAKLGKIRFPPFQKSTGSFRLSGYSSRAFCLSPDIAKRR